MTGPTYIGILVSAETTDGREIACPPVLLGHVPGVGLVTVDRPDDLTRGRYLQTTHDASTPVRALVYFRRRPGYRARYWRHETEATRINPRNGAITSPSALICDMAGDFICKG